MLHLIEPQIVLSRNDVWTWDHGSLGNYTVKEANAWLNNLNCNVMQLEDWCWVWKLKVPEKVRMFVWRVLKDAIPTNSKCFRCNMADSPACSHYSHQKKSILYCLRDCPHARKVWLRLGAQNWQNFNSLDITFWVRGLATGRNALSSCLVFGATGNGVITWSLMILLGCWMSLTHDHDDFCSSFNTLLTHADRLSLVWEPPQEGWVKLNTDGSFRHHENTMGNGGLIRDNGGHWLGGFVGFGIGGNASIVEAVALREGLRLAWNMGYRRVMSEVDSMELIDLLENDDAMQFGVKIMEIKSCINRDWIVKVIHVNRECNDVADCMAKHGARLSIVGVQVLDSPFVELESHILRDILSIV